jgi:antitoxin component of RelBE/YafQ-DinJ toxin-antitoxin module
MLTNGTSKTVTAKPELRVSVRVDARLMKRIDRVAKLSGISSSDVVRMALNQQLPVISGKAA